MHGKVMKVSRLDFDPVIWQSSPFPCDVNTITVSLKHKMVPMIAICRPTITITNLQNAVHDNGVIFITDKLNTQTKNASWSLGSIRVNLADLIPSGAEKNAVHILLLL